MAKKNKTYWEGRQKQWWDNQDKLDDKAVRKLEMKYKQLSKDLEKDIAVYFHRYGKDNVIEFRNLMLSLDDNDRKLLFQSIEDFARKYPKYAHLMPVRESIYKLNRMQGLHYSMNMKLLELGAFEQDTLEKHLLKTYGDQYAALMGELGLGQTFVAVNNEMMMNTIYTNWVNGENFSDRIWNNKEKMYRYMQTDFRDAIARGDSYDNVARIMARRFDVGTHEAKRLVATESAFVFNQSHIKAYTEAGVTEYEFSAVMDSKTSRICRNLDGERFRFDEAEVGLNFPPMHTWCRSTFIGVLDGLLE
ncbi:minor capsid protein [Bacillus sp. FSL K6-3431]|uniref:minor capsid protein n=1 Tax=Bacillus sp. FSL K6-3431 TaxID=2921500 RepID=UPI0030F90BF2